MSLGTLVMITSKMVRKDIAFDPTVPLIGTLDGYYEPGGKEPLVSVLLPDGYIFTGKEREIVSLDEQSEGEE